ncbi:MAG: hypothetical protein GYB67_11550 [Chloroflexi bacterium]|nr:hypothetical protein [Chloroflexota bacterium]
MQRLLIEKIEHRIIVGILSFLGIMILVGWIAINENGRMQAFEQQYEARAIERGAYLYNTNCSECHATDGLGLVGRAPGLNNPYLFGHDFLGSIRRERDSLERELLGEVTAARQAEIEARMVALDADEADIRAQMQTAIDNGYNPDSPDRLVTVGWGGTLDSYLLTTLIHGRPLSGLYWPTGQGMSAWSQTAGGPLRTDQLEDLTAFILNYDKGSNWTIEDLNAVVQFPIEPVDPSTVVIGDQPEAIGTDVDAILAELVNYTGDPVNGQQIYNTAPYVCSSCHMNAAVAPLTELTWAVANGERLEDPLLAGYTPEQYLVESIVAPNDYIVPGYPANVMTQNFGERMPYQDLADILAYLQSYDTGVEAAAAN